MGSTMLRHRLFLFLAVASAAIIAACGGGGGGGSSPIPGGGSLTPSTKSAGATVRVLIPNSSTSSSARKPAFISPSTATISIGVYTVNGATPSPLPTPLSITIASNPDCTTVSGGTSCTITVTVPIATSVVLQISSYDASNNLLGQGLIGPINTTLATIPTQSVSIGGVPASIVLEPSALSAGDDGLTHPLTLAVFAKDAGGNFIIPPGNYPTPITLAISGDPNNALSLSTTSIASPGPSGSTTVTVDYNSANAITQGTITATSGSITASVPFAPIVFTPTTVSLLVGGPMQTVTVSEAGYGGAFSTPGPSTVATVTCVPANCTPSSVGGSITLNIAPGTSVGSEVLSPVDSNGGFANIPITLTSSGGGGALVAPPYTIHEYSTTSGGANYGITVGADGQTLWFLDRNNAELGSVTSPAGCTTSCGTISEQSPFVVASGQPAPAGLQAITPASDGNLYLTDLGNGSSDLGTAYQVSCSAGTCNQATMLSGFPEPTPAPGDVLAAPDGNIYFSSQFDNLYQGGSIFYSSIVSCCSLNTVYVAGGGPSSVNGMTIDPSGQTLWFTDSASGSVGFFPIPCEDGCNVTELPSGATQCQECGARHRPVAVHRAVAPRKHRSQCCGSPFAALNGIVLAPDGNLYVAEAGANVIDQLNPTTWATCVGESCVYTPIALPISGATPMNLIVGPDGNVWFTDTNGYVGFVSLNTCTSPGGCKAFEYHVGGAPWGITVGPDGDIWFTDSSTNAIGKVMLQ
jgi:streptogramin lyase